MHREDKNPEILLNLVRLIENGTKHKVKILRSDNKIKFKNSIVEKFCRYKSITQQCSTLVTPQQNDVMERKDKTLIEAGRTMLEK